MLGVVATVGLVAVRAAATGTAPTGSNRSATAATCPPASSASSTGSRRRRTAPRGPGQGNGHGNGQRNGQGGPGNGLRPAMRGAMGLGNVQHGEFTVQDNGKATVMTLQRGEVTKASATSVTVKSADDFTATYVVGDDTRGRAGDLKVGDSVVVVAEKAGAKAVLVTATRKG